MLRKSIFMLNNKCQASPAIFMLIKNGQISLSALIILSNEALGVISEPPFL